MQAAEGIPTVEPVIGTTPSENGLLPIGVVLEIAGSSSHIALDPERLRECGEDADLFPLRQPAAHAGRHGWYGVPDRIRRRWRVECEGPVQVNTDPAHASAPTAGL